MLPSRPTLVLFLLYLSFIINLTLSIRLHSVSHSSVGGKTEFTVRVEKD